MATAQPVGERPAWVDDELFPFESRFVALDGNVVHYVDEGSGPILLMLHSNPVWSFVYREVIVALRDGSGDQPASERRIQVAVADRAVHARSRRTNSHNQPLAFALRTVTTASTGGATRRTPSRADGAAAVRRGARAAARARRPATAIASAGAAGAPVRDLRGQRARGRGRKRTRAAGRRRRRPQHGRLRTRRQQTAPVVAAGADRDRGRSRDRHPAVAPQAQTGIRPSERERVRPPATTLNRASRRALCARPT